jgi:hypothetical protein
LLNFQDPDDSSKWRASADITADTSAWNLRNKIYSVYRKKWGSDVDVTKEMFDANDVLTEDAALSVKNVYTVECRRLISRQSAANILVAKKTTDSTISVELPNVVQLSSTPLTGSFKIKCIDSEGYESFGEEREYQHNANWDAQSTFQGCDQFYDRFEMFDTYE